MPSLPKKRSHATKRPSGAVSTAIPRAILYDRVSTVSQSSNYSGGKDGYQIDTCRAYATARGWPIVGEISDVGSGADWEIDGVLEAVERAKRGEYDKLVVFETSRFARDVGKKAVYEAQLHRHGVQVVYLNLPEDGGDEAELLSDFLGAFAAFERKSIRRRVMGGIRKKVQSGKVLGAGVAPYGYEYVTAWNEGKGKSVPVGLAAHPERGAVAVRIITGAATMTLGDLAATLTAERIPTPTGRSATWKAATLSAILANTVYIGAWRHGEATVAVPPLVDQTLWQEMRSRLAERTVSRRGRMPEAVDEYLLRGALRCGHCGGLLATWKQSRWTDEPERSRGVTRSYLCLRHKPGRAARAGVDVCALPMLPASIADEGVRMTGLPRLGIEDAARQWVEQQVLNPRALSDLVERADEMYGEQQRQREQRIADLDAKMLLHQRRLERAVEEQLDVERASPKYAVLVGAEQRETDMLAELARSRAVLVAMPEPGLSAASLQRLAAVIDAYAAGIDDDQSQPERLRELYRTLRVRGVVTRDAAGPVRLGHHRYRVAWTALIQGDVGNSDKLLSENWTLFSSDGRTVTSVVSGLVAA